MQFHASLLLILGLAAATVCAAPNPSVPTTDDECKSLGRSCELSSECCEAAGLPGFCLLMQDTRGPRRSFQTIARQLEACYLFVASEMNAFIWLLLHSKGWSRLSYLCGNNTAIGASSSEFLSVHEFGCFFDREQIPFGVPFTILVLRIHPRA
ncbi:hypothetical protein FB45DRAFT_864645 [Roridomyces roridus]|uniref:Hydrophobin n=1 Tax=Roridomyces roridus TaxID=1738132 RepID=A0AAD7C1J6_9AGAR|nr:hypothetical protein FB45DRAFT_864645 [Roridomyces roridus]